MSYARLPLLISSRGFSLVPLAVMAVVGLNRSSWAAPPNRNPPTVEILSPSAGSQVTGTVEIAVEACAVPATDDIVGMEVRFHSPGGSTSAWRSMNFTQGPGCVPGSLDWDAAEFGDGSVGIEVRAADFARNRTKWSTGTAVTVTAGSGGSQDPVGVRHLFVWDSTIPQDSVATADLLTFSMERGVDVIYINGQPVANSEPNAVADYAAFVGVMHDQDIKVYALGGHPFWGVACDQALPGQTTCQEEGWNYYQSLAESGVPFDGFIDNTEPYNAASADWWSRLQSRAQQYLDFYHGIRARIGSAPLTSTIPFWLDQDPNTSCMKLDGRKGQCRPLNWYVCGIADDCAIMDYRDVAEGPNGLIAHATGEVETHPTIVGVETDDLGSQNDFLTFHEEGVAAMELELAKVWDAFAGHANFRGFFIHYYDSYRNLVP